MCCGALSFSDGEWLCAQEGKKETRIMIEKLSEKERERDREGERERVCARGKKETRIMIEKLSEKERERNREGERERVCAKGKKETSQRAASYRNQNFRDEWTLSLPLNLCWPVHCPLLLHLFFLFPLRRQPAPVKWALTFSERPSNLTVSFVAGPGSILQNPFGC